MTTFRNHDDVAVIECDPATGKPAEGGQVLYGTVTGTGLCSVTARCDGATRLFLADSRNRAWAGGGRLRLVPVCAGCGEPITGTPTEAPGDPLDRKYHSQDCLTATAEGWAEGYYGYGVAT